MNCLVWAWLLPGLAAFLFGPPMPRHAAGAGVAYYLDSREGNDANAGTSPDSAWQTLDKVNATVFQPGDRLLLRAGGRWTGSLRPKGSGRSGQPIVVDQYGDGGIPRIEAGVGDTNALWLVNQSCWEISHLELTNQNPAQPNDRTRRGVYVEARGQLVENIHLRNLVIHDVRGLLAKGEDYNTGKDSAGIGFEVTDDSSGARFHDLLVDGCEIQGIDSTGIFTKGRGRVYPRARGWDAIKFTNVVLQNNRIHDIGKNAIIVRQLDGGFVQGNTVWDTAFRCESGNQVFSRSCYGTIFQFNEGYLNRSTADMDGSAFDADLESPGTVWQYNYSHDNKFGLITFCTTAPDDGIVVRYNISRNDKGRLLNINYNLAGAAIYNNLFYVPPHLSPQIIWETHARTGANFTGRQTYTFDNNIIYNLSPTATYNLNPNLGSRRLTARTLRHNCFFGRHPAGEPVNVSPGELHVFLNNITGDPDLVLPGSGGNGIASLMGYRLRNSSPCLRAGIPIEGNGGRDFWGNPVPGGPPDIGAHQHSAGPRASWSPGRDLLGFLMCYSAP